MKQKGLTNGGILEINAETRRRREKTAERRHEK
jgi:hypothetical protein